MIGMHFKSILLCLSLIFLPVLAQNTANPLGCFLNFHRVIGRRSIYVWACVCNGLLTTAEPTRGRVELQTVPTSEESHAETLATARCIRNATPRALRICLRNGMEFQEKASRILRRCAAAQPNQVEKSQDGPFRYNQDKCQANSYRVEFPFTGVVWVCQCEQRPRYFISPGRVDFRSSFPTGTSSLAETRVIDRCSRGVKPELSRICSSVPGDFEILGLQILATCCKRSRVALAKLKFQCDAIVPSDVTIFKDPFLS